ncbi:hypothetical protein CKAH01_17107 [Colletotrichum kahawae]|uniref:3CxxC-type domain-containing protein n=1 Tax=Colletotrichum kahawae TaxID=34407 RepID=A0AAD9YDL1_COLKA|nr:hypothetical protein CKAH01_17107 [Colletotrichum kahawae]
MARGKSAKSSGVTKTAFTFPDLHEDVASAVSDHFVAVWVGKRSKKTPNNARSSSLKGRFTCDNSSCSKKSWPSGQVAIDIRGYPDNGYNATVYNQRCKDCKQLGNLTLDKACYVERVSYWLKKWAGVWVEPPVIVGKGTPPHLSELCEGCKRGSCRKGLVTLVLR